MSFIKKENGIDFTNVKSDLTPKEATFLFYIDVFFELISTEDRKVTLFSFFSPVPAGFRSWKCWKSTGAPDLSGSARTKSCSAPQDAPAATGKPPESLNFFSPLSNRCSETKVFLKTFSVSYIRQVQHLQLVAQSPW